MTILFNVQVMVGTLGPEIILDELLVYLESEPDTVAPGLNSDIIIAVVVTLGVVALMVIVTIIILLRLFRYVRAKKTRLCETTLVEM